MTIPIVPNTKLKNPVSRTEISLDIKGVEYPATIPPMNICLTALQNFVFLCIAQIVAPINPFTKFCQAKSSWSNRCRISIFIFRSFIFKRKNYERALHCQVPPPDAEIVYAGKFLKIGADITYCCPTAFRV